MKMSRTVAYAVQATLQLARAPNNRPVPCSRLAAEGEMPERFLLQILRDLVNHGILQSTRGVDGGYALGRGASQISLLDVVEAIDGPMTPALPEGKGLDEIARQQLRNVMQQANDAVRTQLAATKLSEFMPVEHRRPCDEERAG